MIPGIKVRLPASLAATTSSPAPPEDFIPEPSTYDMHYDTCIVLAGIHAGITDHITWLKLRMWLLGLPVVNDLMPSSMDIDFLEDDLKALMRYVKLRHPNKGAASINHIFRAAHYYLSCHCRYEIRTAVMQRIYTSWTQGFSN